MDDSEWAVAVDGVGWDHKGSQAISGACRGSVNPVENGNSSPSSNCGLGTVVCTYFLMGATFH